MTAPNYDWFPPRIGDQIVWISNFGNKLGIHATTLGISAGTVSSIGADLANATYGLETYRGGVATFRDSAYEYIDSALYTETTTNIEWPTFAAPGTIPGTVFAGCMRRVFALIVDVIKKSPGYTKAIGEDLGIESPEVQPPNPATTKPALKLRPTTGGKLEVRWVKGDFDGIRLEFDLGTAGPLADMDLKPHYTLNWTPPAGTSAVIKVRACYIYKGEDFGQWCDWMSHTLTGE